MAVILCPKCRSQLRAPAEIPDRNVKCPSCGHMFNARQAPRRESLDDVVRAEPVAAREGGPAPSTRRRRRDESEEQSERPGPRDHGGGEAEQFGRARYGLFLNILGAIGIALGLLLTLVLVLLTWTETRTHAILPIAAGLLGALGWIQMLAGTGFFLTGPKRGACFGLAAALMAVAVAHFVIILVGARVASLDPLISLTQVLQSIDPTDPFRAFGSDGKITHWLPFVSELPGLAWLGTRLYVNSGDIPALALVRGLLELTRWVLLALYLRALGQAARDDSTSGVGTMLMIATPAGVAVLALIHLGFVAAIGGEGKDLAFMLELVIIGAVSALIAWFAVALKSGLDAAEQRA